MHPPEKQGHTSPRTRPAVTPTVAQSPPLAHCSHAQRARLPLPDSTRSLGASPDPAPWSYALPPGSPACVRGRSCSEARSRQRPARGWPRPRRLPIPAGPARKMRDQPGRLPGVAASGARPRTRGGSSARDPQETAPDPALASPCSAAPGRAGPGGERPTAEGEVREVCAER